MGLCSNRQLGVAFRDPFQWPLRVAQGRWLDQPQQVAQQARVAIDELLAAAARAACPPARHRSVGKFFQPPGPIVLGAIPVARATAATPP